MILLFYIKEEDNIKLYPAARLPFITADRVGVSAESTIMKSCTSSGKVITITFNSTWVPFKNISAHAEITASSACTAVRLYMGFQSTTSGTYARLNTLGGDIYYKTTPTSTSYSAIDLNNSSFSYNATTNAFTISVTNTISPALNEYVLGAMVIKFTTELL